jgi:energy-coupling factor transporter ATP-binding protein EcfA2
MPGKDRGFDRLRMKNVRCFRDAEIPLDERVTVIVGANASGKTTLMEALASITNGDDEGLSEFPLRHGAGHGEIALYESGGRSAIAKWDSKQAEPRRLPTDRHVFLYGRYRRVPIAESERESRNLTDAEYLDELASHADKARTTTLTRPDNRLLQDVAGYLRGLNFGRSADPRLDTLWSRLNAALPEMDASISEIKMEQGDLHLIPKIVRNGVPLELTQLSDGYQAIIVIVLDLMLRYAYLFLEENSLAGSALVGIDEIDLHLHPRWQRTVLPQLTALFPNTQFVLTTHSPIVVQAAIDQGFTVLRLMEKDGAVTAQRLSNRLMKSLRGAEVGSLLFEAHLFGVGSRFSVEYGEIEKRADELQAKVSSGAARDADYRELKNAIDELEELVAKEDRRRADGSTMAQMVRMQGEFVKALTDELRKARK